MIGSAADVTHRLGCCWLYRDIPGGFFMYNLFCEYPQEDTQLEGTSMDTIRNYWKLITATAGSLLMFWNEVSPGLAGILPTSWSHGITVVVGVLTILSTYAVPGPNYGRHAAAE